MIDNHCCDPKCKDCNYGMAPTIHPAQMRFCEVCHGVKNASPSFIKACKCGEYDPWEYHQGTDGDL